MSKADLDRWYNICLTGQDYQLGNEAFYDIYSEPSTDPLDTDCSGKVIATWLKSNVLVGGSSLARYFGTPRPTAHSFYMKAQPLVVGEVVRVGDLGFLVNSRNHAYHIFEHIGHQQVEEAGYNHKVRLTTVAVENRRAGVRWGRIPTDLGVLTDYEDPNVTLPPWPTLKYGMRSVEVRLAKGALNVIQAAGLDVNNNFFGTKTKAEVKEFQSCHTGPNGEPLKVVGYIGPHTLWALVKAAA